MPMELSAATTDLLGQLAAFSKNKISRSGDLGILIELAARQGRMDLLKELCFVAKFLHHTHRIMQRIGPGGNGYDKLEHEFRENLPRETAILRELLRSAPEDTVRRFASTYLAMTPEAVHNLLALSYDLSWYKNWLIDRGKTPE